MVYYHFTREHIAKGDVELQYVSTKEMVADIITKSLTKVVHEHFSRCMGLRQTCPQDDGECYNSNLGALKS